MSGRRKRLVSLHVTLEEARANQRLRERCLILELHGFYWCAPVELTIHEVAKQTDQEMARLELAGFPKPARVICRPPRSDQ